MCQEDGVYHIIIRKAQLAENYIRNLRSKLAILTTQDLGPRSLDSYVQEITSNFNKTSHTGLEGLTPMDGVNRTEAFQKMIREHKRPQNVAVMMDQLASSVQKAGLKVGYYVKIKTGKDNRFTKMSQREKIGHKIYKITKIKLPSIEDPTRLPYYKVSDWLEREQPGNYFLNLTRPYWL